jgi:tyrosine-protein phosphatase YwqE
MFGRLFNKFKLSHTTDIHSHLIPAIDDGSKSLEQSIQMIRYLYDMGFKKIITTPHIMSHRFLNDKKTILDGYDILKQELIEQDINIDIEVAAEYYYDDHFLDLIKKDEIMSFGDKYILFELSYHNKPLGLEQTVHQLLKLGYKPVLAHPERYTYYTKDEDYLNLKEMGLLFQINAISTQGFYGKAVQKAVQRVINLGIVDFIGSDIHSMRYLEAFQKSLKSKIYTQIITNNQIKNDYL